MDLIELKRNFLKFFYFLLFSIPFLVGAIWQNRDTNPLIPKLPVINTFLNFEPSFTSGLLTSFFQLFLFTSPIILITILEFLKPSDSLKNRILSTSLGRMHFSKGYKFADIWYFVIGMIMNKFPQIVSFLTLGFVIFNTKFSNWFSSFYKNTLNIPSSPLLSLFIFVIAVLLLNLLSYVNHRISHEIPFFWDLHELHHTPTEMTMLSKERKTPFDNVFFSAISIPFETICSLLALHFLKEGLILPIILWVLYFCLDDIHSWVGHSSFKLVYPKPFNYILMSPSLHWIHHSTNPKHFQSNYGNTLCIWDRIFNTYLDETYLEDIKSYGFKNSEYNKHHPLYSLIFLPIIKMKKRLVKINNRYRRKLISQRN